MEFLIIIVLFVGMMWLMTRGQRKQAAAAEQFRAGLEVGQKVMTHSGFYGEIVDIDGDVVTLESMPGVETLWKRSAIASLSEPPFAAVDDDAAADDAALDGDVAAGTVVPDDASSLAAPGTTTPPPPPPTVQDDTDDDPRRA